jgi:CheY-like chemotaxis protein
MEKLRIFLVEDDADDIDLLSEAFKLNNINCDFEVVTEGDKVIPRLEAAIELPHVIVMDMNLPRLHGRELLAMYSNSKKLSKIPLVVLTTSSAPEDERYSYEKGARRFLTKPNSIEGFNAMVNSIVSVTGH